MDNSMTIDEKTNDYTIPEVLAALERGPQWLRERRKLSRDDFNTSPLPRRGLALWRYTDPKTFIVPYEKRVDTSFHEDYDEVVRVERQHVDAGHLAALVTDYGGREIKTYGTESLSQEGIVIAPLSTAVETNQEMVQQHLYSLINSETGKFEAMNGALWNDGIFVYVPDGKTVTTPIHLLREAGLEHSVYYPRLLVVVGKNAEVTLVDEYGGGAKSSENGISYINGAVEIIAHDDSRVRYVSLQRLAEGANMYLTHRASIKQNATMLTVPLAFGANISKQNFGVILDGPGAESNMYGLLFGSKYQHFDNHTLHEHKSSHTNSNIDFKVVLRDKAVSAYTGLIRIDKTSRTCEAYQENRNLLLNTGTKAETIPELEILNEDVKCSHGATIGPIDPDMVFYLASRGIPHDTAVRMIVSGFIASTLQQIPDDLRERIGSFIDTRLEGI